VPLREQGKRDLLLLLSYRSARGATLLQRYLAYPGSAHANALGDDRLRVASRQELKRPLSLSILLSASIDGSLWPFHGFLPAMLPFPGQSAVSGFRDALRLFQ
jgi:hypothetical protein